MYNDRFGTRAHLVRDINYEMFFSSNQLDGRHFSLHFQVFQAGHEKKKRPYVSMKS